MAAGAVAEDMAVLEEIREDLQEAAGADTEEMEGKADRVLLALVVEEAVEEADTVRMVGQVMV